MSTMFLSPRRNIVEILYLFDIVKIHRTTGPFKNLWESFEGLYRIYRRQSSDGKSVSVQFGLLKRKYIVFAICDLNFKAEPSKSI